MILFSNLNFTRLLGVTYEIYLFNMLNMKIYKETLYTLKRL